MKKKYIIRCITDFLPLFIVTAIILILSATIQARTSNFFQFSYSGVPGLYSRGGLTMSYVAGAISLTFIYPLFALNYRFKVSSSDFYQSLPFKEKELKRIRLLVALGLLLIAFTIAHFSGMMVAVSRYFNDLALEKSSPSYPGYVDSNFNFVHYFTTFPIFLIAITLNYFIAAAIENIGNNVLDSFIYITAFEILSGLFTMGVVNVLESVVTINNYETNLLLYNQVSWVNPSLMTAINFANLPFDLLVLNSTGYQLDKYLPFIIVGFVLFAIVGILAALYLFFIKDPSGEYSGKSEARNNKVIYLIHGAYLVVSLISVAGSFDYLLFFLRILIVIGHYISTVILTRSFKISKQNIIAISVVAAINLSTFILGSLPFLPIEISV